MQCSFKIRFVVLFGWVHLFTDGSYNNVCGSYVFNMYVWPLINQSMISPIFLPTTPYTFCLSTFPLYTICLSTLPLYTLCLSTWLLNKSNKKNNHANENFDFESKYWKDYWSHVMGEEGSTFLATHKRDKSVSWRDSFSWIF